MTWFRAVPLTLPALLCLWLASALAPVPQARLVVFAALSGAAFWMVLAWAAGGRPGREWFSAGEAARAAKRAALRNRLLGR